VLVIIASRSQEEHGIAFRIGDMKASLGSFVSASTAGEAGVILVSAQTDDQAHLVLVSDSLRKYAQAEWAVI